MIRYIKTLFQLSSMSCSQAVLMTKSALDKDSNGLDIIVDNNIAKEKIKKFYIFFKSSIYSI